MLQKHYTTKFKKDYKKAFKQGKKLEKLDNVIDGYIVQRKSLPLKYKDHALANNWKGYRECHIEPDWLLIYKIDNEGGYS